MGRREETDVGKVGAISIRHAKAATLERRKTWPRFPGMSHKVTGDVSTKKEKDKKRRREEGRREKDKKRRRETREAAERGRVNNVGVGVTDEEAERACQENKNKPRQYVQRACLEAQQE